MDHSIALEGLREASDEFLFSYYNEAALVIRELGDRLTKIVSRRGFETPQCIFCQDRAQKSIQVSVCDSNRTTETGHPALDQEEMDISEGTAVNNEDANKDDGQEEMDLSEGTAVNNEDANKDDGQEEMDLSEGTAVNNEDANKDDGQEEMDNADATKDDGQEKLRALQLYTGLLSEIPQLWDLIPKHMDEWIKDIYQGSDRWKIFIERLERLKKPTTEDKVYRALSLRGLALRFSDFDRHYPSRRNKKRDGRIPKFVRDHLCAPEEEIQKISHYIRAGQKHLKIEEAFRHELEQRNSIYAGEAYSGRGISALTALAITPFRNLQLSEIPRFVDKFFADGANIKLRLPLPLIGPSESLEKEFRLLEVVERASRWFTELQSCFLSVTIPSDHRKRRRLSSYRADKHHTMSSTCGSASPSQAVESLTESLNLRPVEVLHTSDPPNNVEMSHVEPTAIEVPFQFGSSGQSTSHFAKEDFFCFASNSIVSQTGEMNETNAARQETTGFDPFSSDALFISQIDSIMDQTGEINETNAAMQETVPLRSTNSTGQAGQAEQEIAKNTFSALFPDFQTDSISSEVGQMPLTPHTSSSHGVNTQAGHDIITV